LVATLGLGVALAGCSGKVPVKDPLASLDTGEVKGRTDSGISRANYRADLNEYLNSAGLVVSEV